MLTPENMLIVASAAFMLFGGKNFPELGRTLGHSIREFRAGTQGLTNELTAQISGSAVRTPQVPQITAAAATAVVLPSAPVRHVIVLNPSVPAEPEKISSDSQT